MKQPDKIEVLLDSCRGIYIPRDFAIECGETWNIPQKSIDILMNPDHEWYWEEWQHVLDTATCTLDRHTYTLHQDGDLFAVRDDLTEEERNEFYGVE